MKHDAIAVIDFGGQYAHLIATKVRRQNVLAKICQPEDPIEQFEAYKGIIISGSPALGSRGEESAYDKSIFSLDVPILGICFGHQEIARHYGGDIVYGGREWGRAELHLARPHPLFKGLEKVEQVWMSHFDSVAALGPDFEELGFSIQSNGGKRHGNAAIGSDKHRRYGFQFHPEVDDTVHGDQILANFLFEIAGCRPTWTMHQYVDEQVAAIRQKVGPGSVFLLASGGVDSTVAAKLIGQALGPDRLHLLHIDNGLMRKDESKTVMDRFRAMGLEKNLHFVDASEIFLDNLKGIVEPEKKREIIGNTFVHVFQKEAVRLGIEDHLLGQGTIYPDTIETGGTKRADTIKTHHNRVPLIEKMIAAGKVIEPLSDLYKVEVRELGEQLGIDRDVCWRHPFPGPGLGIRLLCATGQADMGDFNPFPAALREISARCGVQAQVLPIRSVGVKADVRSYEHPVLLSGTGTWQQFVAGASAVLSEVSGVNRCIYYVGSEPPKEVRALGATVTEERLDLLREVDFIVMQGLKTAGLYDRIWQCPTVLVPMEINGTGRELAIVRPIHSERAMTAAAAELPQSLIKVFQTQILPLTGISGLAIDLTSKPPGTIEWE